MKIFGAFPARRPRASSPRHTPHAAVLVTTLLVCSTASATDPVTSELAPEAPERRIQLDLGLSATHFQQQAKTEIGGERGERLVDQSEIGIAHFATYELCPYLHAGLFTQLDFGSRRAGRFESFDEDGKATLSESVGGDYWEWWLGPLVRGQYQSLFFELGWGAVGFRGDDGRSDITDAAGNTDGSFRVTPSVAWLVALGGAVPLTDRLALSLRAEYRVRYYLSRGGEELSGGSALGSQNMTPIVGLSWSL